MSEQGIATLTEILCRRARQQPDRTAFTFLADGEVETERLTYAELDERARAVAALLDESGARNERVLLLFDAGLEFITSFFGCLYAGAVAVPAPPPHPERLGRTLPRLQAIVGDSRPALALTTASLLSMIEGAPDLRALRWLKVDEFDPEASARWQAPLQTGHDLAYLQYTSGSTSTPKGVMVTHFCLSHQSERLARAYGYTPESVSATWMPNFHDYGLVEGIVHPAVYGVPAYLFSSLAFVQRPARWLEIITRYGVTHSSGPNFAYELCARKVTPEERARIDLGCWRVAGNAAEPVHRETIERFTETFASCRFRREVFYPSFGLAEATLMVSAGGPEPRAPLFITARASALEQERRVVEIAPDEPGARSLVGCGRPIADTEIAIVDPETHRGCAPDELGEIWVKCAGLAHGFWQRPEETEEKFHARTADTHEGPFLRTGDLGFMRYGELFIGGRVKDLIIIRGQNYYPQDVEWTAERSHGLLRPGCCAAFAVEVGLEERLILVLEVRPEFGPADEREVLEAIRERVAERHELQPYAVVLVKTGTINKTSSGKIQRHASRREFLEGTLEAVARWQTPEDGGDETRFGAGTALPPPETTPAPASRKTPTVEAVREWLAAAISRRTGILPAEVNTDQPFRYYGFDSARVVEMVGGFSAWLGRPLPPTFFWDYPTVERVARHVGEESAPDSQAAPDARTRPVSATGWERAAPEPIAIVGMACRFPGAENVEAFWRLLRDGGDAITEVPPGRWETGLHGFASHGGFLKQVDGFDAHFFGISPREAAQTDPQQRLLLEVAWEALEDAGYAPDRLGGTRTGVFVGISNSDYALLQFNADASPDAYAGTGSALSIAANRLSYLLDLHGPSMAIDTACSSSLVAVHAACQSLRAGESRATLAGGVNLLLTPKLTEALARAGMMSAVGRCKTFDAAADGYVRAEGCGVVVLKRLSDALADGDRVVALIRGSAINQDGRSNGLTAPNGLAQQALVREALGQAGVAAADIGYVEAHGTGTPLGDPIEFAALGAVLREGRSSRAPCYVGSVKTNVGHLEAAAGIAGLIKVALCLEREHVPPHLHLRDLNPRLATADSPLEIVTRGRDWKRGGAPRRAGVSSFGFGGTNAHVVLEDAPVEVDAVRGGAPVTARPERPAHVFCLSAQSDGALRELAHRVADHLTLRPEQPLADVCFTANVGRARFAHRLALTCETRDQLRLALHAFARGERADGLRHAHVPTRRHPRTAFLFTGQGAQYLRMGSELYKTQPSFRRMLERCDEILRPALERPLLSALYGEAESAARLDETAYTQPALFALEYALAELWRAWGVEPDFVFGHSVGEYAAACFAGAFTLEEGLGLVAERARLMQLLPPLGEMAAVFADAERVAAALEPDRGQVSIAAVNGPAHTVVSGEREAVRAALRRLAADGVTTRALNVSHAFHSPLMEPMLADFERALRHVPGRPLRLPLVSGLTGEMLATGTHVEASHWLANTREPVRFDTALRKLAAHGCEAFVEVGPDAPLLNMGRRCLPGADASWLPTLQRGQNDWRVLLGSLSALYVAGVEVDWSSFDRDYPRRRLSLPTYPFERKSYWLQAPTHRPPGAEKLRAPDAAGDFSPSRTNGDTPEGDSTMTIEPSPLPRAAATDPCRKEAILETLRAIVGRLLQTAPETLDADASFLEMGADSIVLAEAIRVIEDTFLLRISIRQLFEEVTTLDALAAHIEQRATPAPPPARPDTPRAAIQTSLPVCAMPMPPAQGFAELLAPAPELSALEAGVSLHADSPERIISRQLDLLAQFSGLMSQQLSVLGQGLPLAPPPTAVKAHEELRKQEAQGPSTTFDTRPQPPPPAPSELVNGGGAARAPYVAFQPVQPGAAGGLSERQRQHLSELVERFTRRTAASKQLAQQYRPVLADSRAIVGFRLSIKEMLYPIVGAGADGARLRDLDGNEYIDITMGFGVHLFGHRPPFVTAAVEEQLRRGIEMGPRPALAGEVAALVCELTRMERATFCNSGTEAVMTALRLARSHTRRMKVAIFAGSYHGHSDGTLARAQGGGLSVPLAPGIPAHVAEDVLVLEYGSPRALELLHAHANELAAVLVEPVQSRHPELQPREFLHELRAWTQAAGVVLIFDEMVTGFRVHPGGAQAWFGVAADLATYGKIAGGGLPIGIVAGRAPFMDGIDGGLWEYGDASYPRAETTYFGGTFCQHPLAMASARAVLAHLKERGPSLQAELNERTSRLATTLNEHFAREEMPLRVAHFGSLFRFNYTGNMDLLFYHLLTKGVYVWEWRNCFLSTAHTDEDVEIIVRAVAESAAEMRAGGFIADKSGGPTNGARPTSVEEVGAEVSKRQALGFWGRREMKPALVGPPARVEEAHAPAPAREAVLLQRPNKAVRFSLSFFGNYEAGFDGHKYDLLIEGAKFADRHGFEAVWIPERHFHAFGGFSPNPSVIAAALARETEHVRLRAGSVVLPLHHAVRVAEEWSVVDNLSRGRVGVSFASGWHPDDFIFAPEAYGRHRELMFDKIEEVRQLWRGESVAARGGAGNEIRVRLFPQPMQRELPVWITVVNNPETYRRAGEIGAGILTNLMGQTVEDLARNVALYRRALADHGHDPTRGHVALLLHTFVGAEAEAVRKRARRPFCDYLKSSLDLLQNLVRSQGLQIDFERLSEDDLNYLLSSAYERYVRTSALVGTPETCAPVVQRLADIGVDELACFIDFGVEAATVLGSLPHLDELRELCRPQPSDPPHAPTYGLAAEPARIVRRVQTTEAQRQLWVLAQVGDDASCAYNETLCLRLRGPLNLTAFADAVRAAVARHEALWTSLSDDGAEQLVHAPSPRELPLTDFSGAASAAEREAGAAHWLAEECRRKFDLGVAPLLRSQVFRLEAEHHLFVLSTHHVISDGWSVGVLLDEICAAYEAGCRGVAWESDAPLQFGDYAESLRRPEKLAKRADDESFWVTRLGGDPPRADLPADRPRPPAQTYRGARLHTSFEQQLCEELKSLGRRHGGTLFMTLLAGYLALLHRLTGQADVVIGIPVAGREGRAEARLVGFCTRPLPLRSRLAPGALDPTFAEFMAHVRGLLLEAYEHADYSVLGLVEKLRRPRDASRFPLFSTTFNLEPLSVPPMFGLEVEWVSSPVGHSKFDLSLNVMERGDELRLDCDFNTDLFDSATVARTLGYFRTLLEDAARHPARRLSELALMTEAQRRQVVTGWNDEAPGAREFRCLHEEFAQVARRMGNCTAVVCGERTLSYAELDERSGRLARRLRRLGVGPGALVGLCTERSAEMVVGMLGVLKAGGAYVPLDPSYPQERLAFMLDDAQAHVLLIQSSLAEKFNEYWGYTIRLDAEGDEEEGADAVEGGLPTPGAENLAYVIYTSGSTGQPKGVAVPHRAVHNLVRGTNYVTLEESDVVAQVSNMSFDAATFEVWGALLSGGSLVIIEKDVALAPHALAAQLEAHGVTVMFLTTALFNHMARELPAAFRGLRHLLFGGEAVEPKWVREVLEKGRPGRLLHVYGPTETTTFAIWQEVTSVDQQAHLVPIGRPLTNVQIYLLDEHLRPVPVGVPGGLYVGGCGLARGYLDRPALTAERFIPDPFSSEPGTRLYQTGDLARFLPDGCVEFLGRSDQQVKIRGFRVEPGEVEALLSAQPHLAQAAVVAREDGPGDRRLVAYFVAKEGQTCRAGELRRHLAARLPAYMVPSAFVQLDALPLNANGKVDRRALPPPDEGRPELETKFVAPRSAVERRLAGFYAEVLGLQAVGVEDDFFDLGGHSLHATQVISRVRDCFNVELPLTQFFETGTLADLARRVELLAARPPAAGAGDL